MYPLALSLIDTLLYYPSSLHGRHSSLTQTVHRQSIIGKLLGRVLLESSSIASSLDSNSDRSIEGAHFVMSRDRNVQQYVRSARLSHFVIVFTRCALVIQEWRGFVCGHWADCWTASVVHGLLPFADAFYCSLW
jgi:hypothetical protein